MKNPSHPASRVLGLLLVGFLCGCASQYDVTLRNGDVVRTKSKPVLNERGYYVFKDATGQDQEINSMRIRQIEPARRGGKPQTGF